MQSLRLHDPNDNSLNRVGSPSFVDEVAIALGADGSGDGGMVGELVRMRAAGMIETVGLGMNCNKEAHMGAPDEVQTSPNTNFHGYVCRQGFMLAVLPINSDFASFAWSSCGHL